MKIFKQIEHAWRKASKVTGERKFRKALHLRGKNFQSLLNGIRPANSASSVVSSDIYGPSGSIVGRF